MAALVVVCTWFAAFFSHAQPVQGEQATEVVSLSGSTDLRAEMRQQRIAVKNRRTSVVEGTPDPAQFRHEHERVALPSESVERERRVLSSRSYARRQYDDLVPEQFRGLVLEVAAEFELDPRLLASVITVESLWKVDCLGTHKDAGLMQIIPDTAAWIAESLGLTEYDILDPRTNLTMGAWYLHVLIKEYGDVSMALAAYNGGPRMAKFGGTYGYTQKVMRVYAGYGKY